MAGRCDKIETKLNTTPSVVRMCPPATLRNWKFHKPLLAIGNANGLIQIFNSGSGELFRELKVHSYSVVGIEWIGLNAFISYANCTPHPQDNDLIWELCVTELDTGRTVKLKSGLSSDSSVILSVKASHLRQYFIIIYKNHPFEIWDLETLSLLRRIPKKFANIVAAEWSPLYSKKVEPADNQSLTPSSNHLKENFVVTNKQGELFQFSVAGSVVREINKIPPEPTINKPVTSIAWKSGNVVIGQSDGNINVRDLDKKESRRMSTTRGAIRRIRFAPGRGNMKIILLFDDGLDIWDITKLQLVSTITVPRGQNFNILDADWTASDRPVILTSNRYALMTDIELNQLNAQSKQIFMDKDRSGNLQPLSGVASSNEPCYLQ